ncbi:hypothetical protein ACVW0K_000562 [Streptomyces filamentosus]
MIVAPVHALQVLDEEIPETAHDFSVDYIVTPDEVIRCTNRRRPPGLVWDDLTAEKIAAIPVLLIRNAFGSSVEGSPVSPGSDLAGQVRCGHD